jgi:glycosyltransferase involved in cell wall biosynthesis
VTSRRKVLFVINSLVGGGAERVMMTLVAHSRDRLTDYDIALAVLDDDGRAYDVPDWLTVHQLDSKGRSFAAIKALFALIREQKPDLTLSFLTRSNVATTIAALARKRPCIISERTSTATHLGRGARPAATKALIGAIYPLATRVVSPSAGIAEKLVRDFRVPGHKISIIGNPVDAAAIRRAAADEPAFAVDGPYVVAIGRLVAVKNYELLIRAFAKSGIAGRLIIAGDGPELTHLRQIGQELGLADRLVLPGFLDNPYPLLKRARLFALSSNVEGFPNALLEALALDVPAIATNCHDGPAEILAGKRPREIDGLTVTSKGVLSPVGDIESFAQGLRLAIDQPADRQSRNDAGAPIEVYSPETIVGRYWDLIETTLAQWKQGGAARGALP